MNSRGILSAVQSIGVVLGCAAIAYSLSRVPSMDSSSGPMLALIGGAIGLIGVGVGLIARPGVAEFERRHTARQLLGLRIAVPSGFVAAAGWLIAIFISAKVGYWVGLVGILVGICGIVIHNVSLARRER
jgi:hypothetical protein